MRRTSRPEYADWLPHFLKALWEMKLANMLMITCYSPVTGLSCSAIKNASANKHVLMTGIILVQTCANEYNDIKRNSALVIC